MFQANLARLRQENEKLRKRLAAIQQLGLRGTALKTFEANCLSLIELDAQDNISHMQGQNGHTYSPEMWLQRARQGLEGDEIQAILVASDSASEVSQPYVSSAQLNELTREQFDAIARGQLVITVQACEL